MANIINFSERGRLFTPLDIGKVVGNDGGLIAQTSRNVTGNGTYDTTTNNEVIVTIANTFGSGDEGKVISNGELVAQTSDTITENGTYDTTSKSQIVVNVQGGGYTHAYVSSSFTVPFGEITVSASEAVGS